MRSSTQYLLERYNPRHRTIISVSLNESFFLLICCMLFPRRIKNNFRLESFFHLLFLSFLGSLQQVWGYCQIKCIFRCVLRIETYPIFNFFSFFLVVTLKMSRGIPTIIFIIFWDFLMFYQIVFSPEVKRCAIITYKYGIYEFSHELPNHLRLGILGN